MSNQPIVTDPEPTAMEAALDALAPARSLIDRDRLMFQAGLTASRRLSNRRRPWIALAASLAIIALGEAALLAVRPSPKVVERVIVVREPAAILPEPTDAPLIATQPASPRPVGQLPSLGRTDHERLAALVIRYGLDGLPASPRGVRSDSHPLPALSGRLSRAELRTLLEPGDAS